MRSPPRSTPRRMPPSSPRSATIMLVYAAIAARYRGAFWYGFAIAGWTYFVIAFGPWIGSPPGSEPLRAVNRNLVSSVILEIVSGALSIGESSPPGSGIPRALIVEMLRQTAMGSVTVR
jgi:hypothetical protein